MDPKITVVVPCHNLPAAHLQALYESLLAQSLQEFEVLLVDDASTCGEYGLVTDPRFRVLVQDQNRGPAACRNAGAAEARTALLFFTDSDCWLEAEALAAAAAALEKDPITVGNTITDVKTRFGKAVALLGFPGGGVLGFDKVWRVNEDGYSGSFSSCNLGFRKETFLALGGFNGSFPVAGGEDTVLARQALEQGILSRYVPEQVVYHVERSALLDFLRWQIVRGRGNYYIQRHVPSVGGYLKLRLWTFRNSFREAGWRYGPAVLVLLVLSVLFQMYGMHQETRRARKQHRVS